MGNTINNMTPADDLLSDQKINQKKHIKQLYESQNIEQLIHVLEMAEQNHDVANRLQSWIDQALLYSFKHQLPLFSYRLLKSSLCNKRMINYIDEHDRSPIIYAIMKFPEATKSLLQTDKVTEYTLEAYDSYGKNFMTYATENSMYKFLIWYVATSYFSFDQLSNQSIINITAESPQMFAFLCHNYDIKKAHLAQGLVSAYVNDNIASLEIFLQIFPTISPINYINMTSTDGELFMATPKTFTYVIDNYHGPFESINITSSPSSNANINLDTWKAFLEFRTKQNIDGYCCYADQGIGVFLKRQNKNRLILNIKKFSKFKFNDFANNYKTYLDLIEYDELIKIIKDYE